jgi:zeta-carotene desaturase
MNAMPKTHTHPVRHTTVQLRFNGWVTELQDKEKMKHVDADYSDGKAPGLDNLLYSADADFSCFADLALTSPSDYYKPGEGSLLQCVLTPADPYMSKPKDEVAKITLSHVHRLFPSSRDLKCTWSNVVKLEKSLYREVRFLCLDCLSSYFLSLFWKLLS